MTQPMARAVLQIRTRLLQTLSDGLDGNEPSSYFSCGVFQKPNFSGHLIRPVVDQ